MIRFIKKILARRRHAKILKGCRQDGHFLVKRGHLERGAMSAGGPVTSGPIEFWIMGCLCGYNEVTEPNTKPYRRDYLEGERMKKEGEINVQ